MSIKNKDSSFYNQGNISQTLLIPLVARAGEAKQKDPIIQDKKAVEILTEINVGDIIVDGGNISILGILFSRCTHVF